MSKLTACLLVALAVASSATVGVVAARSTTQSRLADGCEWEWAGPATGWVLVRGVCPEGQGCVKPGFNGQFVGQTVYQPCQNVASGSVSDCDCSGR